jgi:uncharacterized protein
MVEATHTQLFVPRRSQWCICHWHTPGARVTSVNETNPDSVIATAATQDERTWGMMAHLSAFSGFLVPLGGVIGPLVVWLIKREQSAFVADQGKEALNFNISVLLAALVCGVLVFIFIGILLGVALFIFWLTMTIIAAIKASEGVRYRYPVALRLVK